MSVRDVIIVGAGPSVCPPPLPASNADRLPGARAGGVLVNSIYRFPPQMVFFTTPELLEIRRAAVVRRFRQTHAPRGMKYYRKVVDTYDLQDLLRKRRCWSVEREDHQAGGARAGGASGAEGRRGQVGQEGQVSPWVTWVR